MVTKKKTEKEKGRLKIKATTGAWWKSTVTAEDDSSEKSEKPKKKPVARKKTTAKTTSKTATKATPAKRTKNTAAEKKSVSEESLKKEDSTESKKSGEKAAKRAPRKRSPRKKPVAKKTEAVSQKAKESVKAPVPKNAETGGPEPDTVSEPTQEGTVEAEKKTAVKKKVAPRKPRGRKPRAKVEKPALDDPAAAKKQAGQEAEKVADEGQAAEPETSSTAKPALEAKQESSPEQVSKKEKGPAKPKAVRKLLINAEEPEETRIALLEDGRLESIHVSSVTRTRTKNNIYKAKIVAIEPSLQAAFVDYGTEKNGFLPFSEIHPEYYKEELDDHVRAKVEAHQWKKLSITDVVERGQEILAQVVKEEVGKKGANMTTYLSLPGRCVVLMPGSDSSGISRKISGEEKRSRLRDAMNATEMPEGIGWIVRTASIDITKTALSRDVGYLLRLWSDIKKKGQSLEGVGLVYEDHHNVLMFLREHFDPSIVEILVDDRTAMDQVKEFIDLLPAKQQDVKVRLHRGSRPIFNQFSVEDQIESIYQPHVNLPSGGSIVINPTEALVAIDVNSGSTSRGKNFEQSIFLANMEAASELARQLRLRDLGGLIVVDFIDMRSRKNILAVEREVKTAMKLDKAKVDFSRISKFGLMEISRQKLGAPIEAGNYRRCDHCNGRGTVRSVETLALFYLRRIQTGASRNPVMRVECHFPLDVASYLLNNKRQELHAMETKYDVEIAVIAETAMKPADNNLVFHRREKDVKNKKQA